MNAFFTPLNTYFSQQGEDIFIYHNFMNRSTPDGIFVELGAMDGIIYSNTKFFEDTLQFTGVLIEPTAQYNALVKNRPKCQCYNVAVNEKAEKVRFIGESATAGMTSTMSDDFRRLWHGGNRAEYYVDGEPMSAVIERSGVKYIDLLTIDVEGGELVVLETFDFRIPVYVVCIELDGHNAEKDEKCRTKLREHGFSFKKRISINEFWVNDDYFRKSLLYDETRKPKMFRSSIREIGVFPCLESHLVKEIEAALQ